ncbi:Brp/Blh family beta-carotene 15,15'-dioxygenase [Fretibacter rubidus]|uniref:Brp/Blh family beta-carotene 15,15'-dioxygenase n=1 Tax=Fretibacter rubidus TaxID=570162 RepID=UPI00352B2961
MRGASAILDRVGPNRLPKLPDDYQKRWLAPALVTTIILLVANALSPIAANWIAIVLFLLGVPHGAVERTETAPRFTMPTLAYTALYIVFGILVFASWLISPLGTFILFLLLSAWHFGQSEPDLRLIGLWVIIGSCLIYPAQTLSIFAALLESGSPPSQWVVASQILAAACLMGLLIEYAVRIKSGQKPSLLRLAFLVLLFLVLPPIPAVAVYFFALHGLGEFARTLAAVSRASVLREGSALKPIDILKLYGPATFPAMIGAVIILWMTVTGYIPMVIAAGLATAFIIPHMLPIEDLLRVDRDAARNKKITPKA